MSDFTIEQLEALKEGTTPGPWVITPHQNPVGIEATRWYGIPMERANADLAGAAPALVDALIAEKQAHAELRAWVEGLHSRVYSAESGGAVTFHKAIFLDEVARILEGDDG